MGRYSIRAVLFLALVHVIFLLGCGRDSGCPNEPSNPVCDLDHSSLGFGSVTVGESSDLTFTIQNTGGGTLSGTASETCDEFSTVGNASYSLSVGQSATFTLRFSPASAGSKACTVETGAPECADVSCSGTGVLAPACQVTPTSLDFGSVTVGQSCDLTFTIQNTGGGTLSGTVSETCDEFSTVGNASYSLSVGQSATFTLRFSPASAGSKACTVETGAPECADVSCSGGGWAPAFDDCGMLVQGVECVLFDSDHFGIYVLDEYDNYGVGNYVRVVGDLDPYCYTICMEGDGCIWVDTISECGS